MEQIQTTQRRLLRRSAKVIAVVSCLALALVGPMVSRANAQPSSDSTGSRVTDFVETLTVGQFDGSLGELALAELTASGEFQSRLVELTNDSGEATDFMVRSTVAMCLQDATLSGGSHASCVASSGPSRVEFDNQVLLEEFTAVPVGATRSSAETAMSSETTVFEVTDVAALQRFVGLGAIDFDASTLTEFSATGGGGNQTVIIETLADVSMAVRYEYAKVDIDAVTNGVDGAQVVPGSTVTWKYTVTNTGTTDLVNLVVSDDVLGPICVIPFIAAGGMDMCVRTGIAGADPYINHATVVADAAKNPAVQVDAADPSSYGVPAPTPTPTATGGGTNPTPTPGSGGPTPTPDPNVTPEPPTGYNPAAIDIELATNGIDSDVPDGRTYTPGDDLTWTYKVINTGTVDLTNVRVSDDLAGAVCTQPFLAVANSFECQLTGKACAGQQVRTSSVVGLATTGVQVTDVDPTHHNCGDIVTGPVPVADTPAAPAAAGDEVLGRVVNQPSPELAHTGGGADGPVALALLFSVAGILAIAASELVRRRQSLLSATSTPSGPFTSATSGKQKG